MKLLIDGRTIGTKPSGIGIYGYNFIQALKEYKDVEIHVLTDVKESMQMKAMDQDERIHVHDYRRKANKSLGVFSYFRFVKKQINDIKPDIFWEINNLAPIKLKNPYGKYVITIHDMFPMYMPECFLPGYKYYFWYGVGRSLGDCDGIVYNSKETRQQTERYFPQAKRKASHIGYIIIPPVPEAEVAVAAADKFYLYMGNLERRKGTDILLQGYERYRQQGGTRNLVLAGKIRESEIEEMVKQMVGDNTKIVQQENAPQAQVSYVGYADGEDWVRLYRTCDCFLFPSRAEGFGMPVIEAMSCGKDVIASDLPIFEEITEGQILTFPLQSANPAAALAEVLFSYEKKQQETAQIRTNNADRQRIVARYQPQHLGEQIYGWMQNIISTDVNR
jgi:glycosyltransferase involved in cell wall biosynthesis